MKKLLLLILSITLLSCSTRITKIEKQWDVYGLNFTDYSEKGFLFTPYSYNGKYLPIGLVTFSAISGAEFKKIKLKTRVKTITKGQWVIVNVEANEVVEYAYKKAKEMGGDALCDFEIERSYEVVFTGRENISLPVINVTGFAIKRLDK